MLKLTATFTVILAAATVALVACTVDTEHTHPTPTALATVTPAPTAAPIAIPSPLPTATPVSIVFPTAVPTVTPVVIRYPTALPTATPVVIPPPLPTSTPAPTATPVVIRYPTPLPTATPAPTATPISIRFPTPLPTSTPSPIFAAAQTTEFAGLERWLRNGVVAVETIYEPQYRNRQGTAWAANNAHGETCLITALNVAAAYTERFSGHDVPVNKTTRIISTREDHRGLNFGWRTVSPKDDLAVLATESRLRLPLWNLAPSNVRIRVGDRVLVMGYDFIDGEPVEPYVTSGIITRAPYFSGRDDGTSLIFFDAPVNTGTHGGVVLNTDMQVIGMVTGSRGPGKTVGLHISEIRETLQTPYVQCR